MQYASTLVTNDIEQVVVLLPIEDMPDFDPENPPKGTYAVDDEVKPGWIKTPEGNFVAPALAQPAARKALEDKLAGLKAKSDALTRAARDEYPQDEVLSWSRQEAEARAYLTDNRSPTPLLSAIASNRSISLKVLAEKVVEKADAYAVYSGHVFGTRQALEERLLAIDMDAPDAVSQIDAVVWPVV